MTALRGQRPVGLVDQRAAERLPVNTGAGCGFAGIVASELNSVRVRDISLHGVGLVVSQRVEVGGLLAVALTHAGKNLHKTVLVRVTHITPVPGGFLLGGVFTEPLSYQEFTALVM